MALAHLGNMSAALDAVEDHVNKGGFFSYTPGSPFWAPLAAELRFMAVGEFGEVENAAVQVEVNAMLERGELILPGHIDS